MLAGPGPVNGGGAVDVIDAIDAIDGGGAAEEVDAIDAVDEVQARGPEKE
jgi:hypothetical protein